jgi:transposase
MIVPDLQNVSIFVRPGSTDMRKQANGLSFLVEELMEQDPGSENLYLFCNRKRNFSNVSGGTATGFGLHKSVLRKVGSHGRIPMKRPELSVPNN